MLAPGNIWWINGTARRCQARHSHSHSHRHSRLGTGTATGTAKSVELDHSHNNASHIVITSCCFGFSKGVSLLQQGASFGRRFFGRTVDMVSARARYWRLQLHYMYISDKGSETRLFYC